MRRGTTPYLAFTVYGWDLTDKTVYVTLTQGAKQLTLTGNRLMVSFWERASAVIVNLTQQETLDFKVGAVEAQVRFIDSDEEANATKIRRLPVERVLLERVIDYA